MGGAGRAIQAQNDRIDSDKLAHLLRPNLIPPPTFTRRTNASRTAGPFCDFANRKSEMFLAEIFLPLSVRV